MNRRQLRLFVLLTVASSLNAVCCGAQTDPATLPPALASAVDAAANRVLAATGVPSASVAIVVDGRIAYTHAYGMARLQPPTPATPSMRYSVGSISKQFTAAAVLMLEQSGKLSLDDKVSKFLPDLTRANEVTLRMLLSHTSGYQDYWPQDYVMTPMLQPVTAQFILDTWAKKPLDFEPGTKWQYSNTNYVIAGRIVEQVSGEPLFKFLQDRIFLPLHMASVYNSDLAKLGDTDPQGYLRYALGPPRPAPKEGAGWVFAAGELAMTASDLARWNISLLDRSLLDAASYDRMFTPIKLKDGTDTGYALGIQVPKIDGRSALEHSGEVSGFVSENIVFPAERAAITVLTNMDASAAASNIGRSIAPLILKDPADAATATATAQARAIFIGLQNEKLDRTLLTQNLSDYFNPQAIADFSSSLKPLGEPTTFVQRYETLRGGMTYRVFRAEFAGNVKQVNVTTYTMPGGKLEQYLVEPAP
jgi:CubicO group peptidase (beta-lactamase class C family)